MAEEKKELQTLRINAGTVVGSAYSQIVSVTVTDFDITLDFIYLHPKEGIEEGQVVSRVTIPKSTGKELIDAINRASKEHVLKKEKK